MGLVDLIGLLWQESDRRSVSQLILMNLSAASHTIRLKDSLAWLGLVCTRLQWFYTHMVDQFQKVVLGDCCTAP